jgi:hypothetical protein
MIRSGAGRPWSYDAGTRTVTGRSPPTTTSEALRVGEGEAIDDGAGEDGTPATDAEGVKAEGGPEAGPPEQAMTSAADSPRIARDPSGGRILAA